MTKVEEVALAIKTYWYETTGGRYIVWRRHMPESGLPMSLRVKECATETKAYELTDRLNARAGIAALREPSETMYDAGRSQLSAGEGTYDIWYAMIDAALKEQE